MGFTLIELLVVISIIGFLAAASLVAFNTVRMKARDVRRRADLVQIQKALELNFDKYNAYTQAREHVYRHQLRWIRWLWCGRRYG